MVLLLCSSSTAALQLAVQPTPVTLFRAANPDLVGLPSVIQTP